MLHGNGSGNPSWGAIVDGDLSLTTPALGTPASVVLTNASGTAAGLSIGGNAATVTNFVGTTSLTNNTGAGTLQWPAAGATLVIPTGGGTLGTAAFTASTAYATAAQGTKADNVGAITGAIASNGAASFSQAACANLSNGATGCSTTVGTAATQNTGTIGAALPFLNGLNTWADRQKIVKAYGTTLGASYQLYLTADTNGNRAEILMSDGVSANAFLSYLPSATAANDTWSLNLQGTDVITAKGDLTVALATNGALKLASKSMINTAPTIGSGLCTSPSVSASNGTAAFALTVGSSCTGVTTASITMPAATTGWTCYFANVTNPATSTPSQTGGTTTTVTLTNYARTTGLAADFTTGDSIRVMCAGY